MEAPVDTSLQLLIMGIFFTLLSIEVATAWFRQKAVFNVKDSLANMGMMLFSDLVIKSLSIGWIIWLSTRMEALQIFALPTGWLTFAVAFVATDFIYYWFHRLSHETPLLWALHHTHHSSQTMNFTIAIRLNWVGKFVEPLFLIPLIVLGLPAEYVFGSMFLGLLYQLFLHTEFLPRLGWLEGKLLNTPSAHRVHHGSNPLYLDKNYAGVFIIWDRLFGTYQMETEPVRYGTTDGFIGYNPLKIQFGPLVKYLSRLQQRLRAAAV